MVTDLSNDYFTHRIILFIFQPHRPCLFHQQLHKGFTFIFYFIVEDGKIRLPFSSLAGVGDAAAESLAAEGKKTSEYLSIEDIQIKTKVTKAVIETLQSVGVLAGIPESSQMSLF